MVVDAIHGTRAEPDRYIDSSISESSALIETERVNYRARTAGKNGLPSDPDGSLAAAAVEQQREQLSLCDPQMPAERGL